MLIFKPINIKHYDSVNTKTDTVILMRFDGIGDFIMSYSVFCEYRKFFQSKKIILICSTSCGMLARAWNLFDEVQTVDIVQYNSDKKYRVYINESLAKLSADIVIQMASYRSIEVEYLTSLIRSKDKIALRRDDNDEHRILRKQWDNVYRTLLICDKANFEIRRNFYLLNATIKASIIPYQALLPKLDCSFVDEEKYFVIAPGGSYQAKKWENEKYVYVLNYILEKKNIKGYILGSVSDSQDNDLIYQKVSYPDKIVNYTGRTALIESIEIIRGADFVITNDTCFVHMAVAVNTKSICVVGGWEWGRFIPYNLEKTVEISNYPLVAYHKMKCYNCNFQSVDCEQLKNVVKAEEKLPCIRNVSIEDVLKLVDNLL